MQRTFWRLSGYVAKPDREATGELRDHPPNAIQKKISVIYYKLWKICWNRWQRIPMTMVARDSKTTLNNRTVLSSTQKRPIEIERSFVHTDTGA